MSPTIGARELASVVFSLIVTLAFLGLLAYFARRWRLAGGITGQGGTRGLRIVMTQAIGWQSSLQIVEAEGQRFLIASGRSGVAAIGRLYPPRSEFSDLLEEPSDINPTRKPAS